jgi:hypothetical protein
VANTTGLFTPAMSVNWLEARAQKQQPGDSEALLDKQADIDDLRREIVAKIAAAAASGRLATEKELRFFLALWGEWGPAGEMRAWVEKVAADRSGLLLILRTLRGTMRSYGGPIPRERPYYRLGDVEKCIDPNLLSSQIDQLDVTGLDPEDANNIALFRKAMARRAQGKPDVSIPFFDE